MRAKLGKPGVHALLLPLVSCAFVLAGCGNSAVPASDADTATPTSSPSNSSTPAEPTESFSDSAESDSPPADQPETVELEVDGQTVFGLPPGLEFPEDSTVSLTTPGFVELSQPSADDIATFYRSSLPDNGFTIDFDTGGTAPVITFLNDDWSGSISMNRDAGAVVTWGVRS